MKLRLALITIFILLLAVLPAAAQRPGSPPDLATITLTNSPGETFTLAVGESYTFNVAVSSDVEFISVTAQPSSYYPGRGVFWQQPAHAGRGNQAELNITMTGKNSTEGEALPVYLYVAVRYPQGYVEVQVYEFNVVVP